MFEPESVPSFRHEEILPSPSQHAVPVIGGPSPTGSAVATVATMTPDPRWLLIDEGFTLAREHEVESLFAIANGYMGNRGSLAEGSPLSAPATFVAGVFEYENKPGAVPGFFLLPDWAGIRAWIEGQPLAMDQGDVLGHRRVLDMRRGVLWREWRHRDVHGRITRVVAFRLASLADRHLLVQSVVFTPENYSGEIQLETMIELPPDVQSSPPPEDWKTRRDPARPNVLPLGLRSRGRDITVAFGVASQLIADGHDTGRRDIDITERHMTERFRLNVEIGVEYRMDRLISIYTSREVRQPIEAAVVHVNSFLPDGARNAVAAHEKVWEERWHDSDVVVEGDDDLQRALRFAAYHLISSANPEDDRVSIGARALTGEAYKGHVFWDTEIYMVPFYSFTHPPSARALLMYRYHTLPAARAKAKEFGYRGAMYPWESADTGEETTPSHVIDPKGKVIRVLNGEMEIHITADVAYAVWQYWRLTGDDDFFAKAGAEIMLETARLWASRGTIEDDGRYHIRHVIGPDEYHENVDDSAFTNLMAAWNLRRGIETARSLEQRWPERWGELSVALRITREELASWEKFASVMYTGFDPKTRLFEQFEGFFAKEHIDLLAYEPRNAAMDVILGHERIQHTNVVKQADIIMASYLLSDQIAPEIREANFCYYEPLTGHGSSLSPSVHALIAARMGDIQLARKYLKQAAEIDLGNNMGNAAGGVHAAAIGGLWQAMVLGFGGLDVRSDGTLAFDPHLLPEWKRLTFPLQYRGRKLRASMDSNQMLVEIEDGEPLGIAVAGAAQVMAQPRQAYVSNRGRDKWGQWSEATDERRQS